MGKHGQRALPLGHEHPEKDSTIKKKFCLPAVVRDLPLLVRSSSAPSSLAKLVSHIQTFSIAVKKKTKERKYKKSFYQKLPTRTVPTAMRRITMRDISKLFSSSAVLRKSSSEPILIKLQVGSSTCTHRSNCQENLLGTGGSVLLHPSPPR